MINHINVYLSKDRLVKKDKLKKKLGNKFNASELFGEAIDRLAAANGIKGDAK